MTPMSQTSPIGTPGVASSVFDERMRRPSLFTTARCFFVPHVASVDAASGSYGWCHRGFWRGSLR